MTEPAKSRWYEIRVRGVLSDTLLVAFPGLRARTERGETVLSGELADRAALHGLLAEVETLGLELLEVRSGAAQRLVLAARLRKGARKRALDLATAMPTHPSTSGFEGLSIYLSESEIVFLIEAPEAEFLVREILDDPVRATEISPWLPLFDGPLHRAEEVYHWSAREVPTFVTHTHNRSRREP